MVVVRNKFQFWHELVLREHHKACRRSYISLSGPTGPNFSGLVPDLSVNDIDLKCGWPTCHSHGGGMVRDSLVRDEPASGGVAVARVPQLGVGALQGIDGHTGGYYL